MSLTHEQQTACGVVIRKDDRNELRTDNKLQVLARLGGTLGRYGTAPSDVSTSSLQRRAADPKSAMMHEGVKAL